MNQNTPVPLRSIAVFVFLAAATLANCVPQRNRDRKEGAVPAKATLAVPSPQQAPPGLLFENSVRPILTTRCAPCHVPGGKMYSRLPFDKPGVVSENSEGILKRLKGDDREAFERWLTTVPTPSSR